MSMIRAGSKTSTQAQSDRMQFAMWDFLKMFFAAILCGVAVSIVAAAIALVLAHDAYAAVTVRDPAGSNTIGADISLREEFQSSPGSLLIGNGCDADVVEAVERDWKVTIDGNSIEIRVMQTFIVPDGDTTVSSFNAVLPTGANLLGLSVHTAGGVWQGEILSAEGHAKLVSADFRNFSRRNLLPVQQDDGFISTDSIINIAANEALTVEYTYRMNAVEPTRVHRLLVSLANGNLAGDAGRSSPINGTVWVEWSGAKPRDLLRVPSGASLETSGSQITGLSWVNRPLETDSRFLLEWTM
jgi:hypothetical protein